LIYLPPILAFTKLQSQYFLFYSETALAVIKAVTVTKGKQHDAAFVSLTRVKA